MECFFCEEQYIISGVETDKIWFTFRFRSDNNMPDVFDCKKNDFFTEMSSSKYHVKSRDVYPRFLADEIKKK